MRIIICLLILCYSFDSLSQTRGIDFVNNKSWEEIKITAKNENKYIFIDCFATWCGPCKQMDSSVYKNDIVGKYFNDKFISIKVQMDKTQADDDQVKLWYQNADTFSKRYRVAVLPTYIFLSPSGILLNKETGFKGVDDFIAIAEKATKTNTVYTDPYLEYDQLASAFLKGDMNDRKFPYLILTAKELGDTNVFKKAANEYKERLFNMSEDELFTKENIDLITTAYKISSASKFFNFFYFHEDKIDNVIGRKGFAQKVVDRIIRKEIVEPFIKIKSSVDGGWILASEKATDDLVEPDWSALYKIIEKKYKSSYAKRNVLYAKIDWFKHYRKYQPWAHSFVKAIKKYGIDSSEIQNDVKLNSACWDIFNEVYEWRILRDATRLMDGVKRRAHAINYNWECDTIDTYANLLFKCKRTKEALSWEEKAMLIASDRQDVIRVETFQKAVTKMKNGLPTWRPGSTL